MWKGAKNKAATSHNSVRRDIDGEVCKRSVIGSNTEYEKQFKREKMLKEQRQMKNSRSNTQKINYRAVIAKKNVQIAENPPSSASNALVPATEEKERPKRKSMLKNANPTTLRQASNEDLTEDINELLCSNEMKSGEYELEKVASVAKLRLQRLTQQSSKQDVRSRQDAFRIDYKSKPNYLVQKLY